MNGLSKVLAFLGVAVFASVATCHLTKQRMQKKASEEKLEIQQILSNMDLNNRVLLERLDSLAVLDSLAQDRLVNLDNNIRRLNERYATEQRRNREAIDEAMEVFGKGQAERSELHELARKFSSLNNNE